MQHSQKKPIFLEDILKNFFSKGRLSMGRALFMFFFGLRKSEGAALGDGRIRVQYDEDSIMLDFRGFQGKSNSVPATRIKCLCGTQSEWACLHKYKGCEEGWSGDLGELLQGGFDSQVAPHSFRIGCTLTLYHAKAEFMSIVHHQRWCSPVVLQYYVRAAGLWQKPGICLDFVY